MYTVTFYSFKGGVGRSMALLNVGAELAKAGRRVLLVDFDLEAPGLDTFDATRPSAPTPGIVDYVSDYLQTGAAPAVRDYVYSCNVPGNGSLWVMPAGRRGSGYPGRLASIDWARLYSEQSGYLLMENLKAQWQHELTPDYVLIDSRTGHTDVGGICTRQLPDAVVIMFFPNDQNLAGLTRIVRDIQEHSAGHRPIAIHFAPSNVPDLDDEDRILAARLRSFKSTLGYTTPAATIHHYSSLALLNQEVFTLTKPRTRLASEYRRLLSAIVRQNLVDADGALEFLSQITRSPQPRRDDLDDNVEDKLDTISRNHATNPRVLLALAQARFDRGDTEGARDLVSRAIELGDSSAFAYGLRAVTHRLLNQPDLASTDAQKVLESGDASFPDVRMAVGLLRREKPQALAQILTYASVLNLDPHAQSHLVEELLTKDTIAFVPPLVDNLIARIGQATSKPIDRTPLVLGCIALGRFADAEELIGDPRPQVASHDPADIFNFAIAEWGLTGSVPRDLMQALMTKAPEKGHAGANVSLCMALAAWATGDEGAAMASVARARSSIAHTGGAFSPWRYLNLSRREFLADCQAVEALINGEPVLPAVLSRATPTKSQSTNM